ncbi:MAG: glycine--tRNA ligase [archaeon GB-1867-005]|nr:glycine--tRNA ligase [Candidatus Culexmicrobium cathedralense]
MDKYDKIMELARRRGFLWPASELYGGVRGFMDFGPLGALLKRNIEEKWRRWFVLRHQDFIVEIETPIVMPSKVFEASGHLEHFTDYIVECTVCHRMFRADHLIEEQAGIKGVEALSADELTSIIIEKGVVCPECGGKLGEVKAFNLLFKTTIGPYSENVGYARPEAAQGMFLAFKRVYEVMRNKLPLGIAQVGKVLRNEISPRQGPIRLREFTIMELELFFDPKEPKCPLFGDYRDEVLPLLPEADIRAGVKEPRFVTAGEAVETGLILNEWGAYFMVLGKQFAESLGIPEKCQMFIEKLPEERAHYSAQTYDQVVKLERWGWVEIAGYSHRTDYDLRRHMEYSGVDLRVFKPYPKPMKIEVTVVKPNMSILGRKFRSEAKRIAEALKAIDPEYVVKELEEKGFVEVAGFKLGRDGLIISKEVNEVKGRRFIPQVVEPSFGADRIVYATLEYAYSEKEGRVVLKLPRDVAPIQVCVFPLVSRNGLPEFARMVYERLRRSGLRVEYDESGSIGRRYARADEVGVPIAVTIDYQSLEDETVTLRDRDSWKQVRVKVEGLENLILKYLSGQLEFHELGAPL